MSAGGASLRIESRALVLSRGERARRILRRVGPLLFVLGAAAGAFTEATHHFTATAYIALCTLMLSIVGGIFYAFSGVLRGRALPGSIDVVEGRISVRRGASVRHLMITDLEQGWLAPPDGVGLRTVDGAELRLECGRVEAEALLDLAGLGPAQRMARIPIASAASWQRGAVPLATLALVACVPLTALSSFAFLGGFFLTSTVSPRLLFTHRSLVVFGISALISLVFGALSIRLVCYLRQRELVIGTDGVALGKRFYHYRDIASVEPFGWGVRLVLRDGSVTLLPVRGRRRAALPIDAPGLEAADATDYEIRETIMARIADAQSVHVSSPKSRAMEVLDRRALPLVAWRKRLRNLLEQEPAYRAPAVDGAEVRQLVADPTATPEQRIAAAVVLSASTLLDDRRQLRIAMETCADSELRAALELAATGEIDERQLARIRTAWQS